MAACLAIVAITPATLAGQASDARTELRVWTTRALATVLAQVGAEFEKASGHRLVVTSGLPGDFERRAERNEPFDLLISGSATVDDWIRIGRVDAGTRTVIARSGIGIAVRSGAPRPDVSSVDAFRTALVGARSLAYLRVGSGLYLDSLFDRLQLRDVVRAKAYRPVGDSVALLVAAGQVELGLVVVTQILTTAGVELAGPLPAAIQSYVTFTSAVSRTAGSRDIALELVRFLQGPDAGRVIVAHGMQRPPF